MMSKSPWAPPQRMKLRPAPCHSPPRANVTSTNSSASEAGLLRIISATHKKLAPLVEAGEFRQDLYYRLNVLPIRIPPLRDRRDDILANHGVHIAGTDFDRRVELEAELVLDQPQALRVGRRADALLQQLDARVFF